jgi:hypothetical protein
MRYSSRRRRRAARRRDLNNMVLLAETGGVESALSVWQRMLEWT